MSIYNDINNAKNRVVLFFFVMSPQTRFILIFVCAVIMSLFSGLPNLFNFISDDVQADTGYSDGQISLLQSLGQLGLYFTLPAGVILDRFGYWKTALGGSLLSIVSLFAVSLCNGDTFGWFAFFFCVSSFGFGAAFITALGVAIAMAPKYGGAPVAFVSGGMSLSLAVLQLFMYLFRESSGCTDESCWDDVFLMLSISMAVFLIPCSFVFALYRIRDFDPEFSYHSEGEGLVDDDQDAFYTYGVVLKDLGEAETGSGSSPAAPAPQPQNRAADFAETDSTGPSLPFLEGHWLLIVKNLVFWVLFLTYFGGISSGLFAVTQMTNIWEDKAADSDSWANIQSIFFSGVTALSNVVAGLTSDSLDRSGRLSRPLFMTGALAIGAAVYTLLSILLFAIPEAASTSQLVFLFIVIAIAGICFGVTVTVIPALVGQLYGPAIFGRAFSIFQFASTAAAFLWPSLATAIHDGTGGYGWCALAIAVVLVVCTVLMTAFKTEMIEMGKLVEAHLLAEAEKRLVEQKNHSATATVVTVGEGEGGEEEGEEMSVRNRG
eukprot:GCRY01002607.1.p1 GENE.GCRY01002607.1~~GCRY01002607.1.p1  ORF type:complete len:547 (-),score=109.54 GCRY01002607.1:591-2231(-)